MDKSARFRSVDCLTIIEQRLPALTGASRQVAEAIMRDPWAVLGMTIYDVAEISNVSLPSVTRFCRAVGFGGFRELVQGIAQSLGRIDSKDFESLHSAEHTMVGSNRWPKRSSAGKSRRSRRRSMPSITTRSNGPRS